MDSTNQIKFMTYNVWSREDVVPYRRMGAIGSLVQEHSPDIIFFQEVTPYIYSIFETFAWWKKYNCSPISPKEQMVDNHFCLMLSKLPLENYARWKFSTTPTGRGYLEADITPGSTSMKPIRIATTQLECPVPPSSMHFRERFMQAKHAVAALSSAENAVFGGDMSWDDNADLPFPLPAGWVDAWTKLKLLDDSSRTYNSFWVEEPAEFNGCILSSMLKRSDRFVCKLQDYSLKNIEPIGNSGIGIRYKRKYHVKNYDTDYIEISPSCHRGLVLTIVPNELS